MKHLQSLGIELGNTMLYWTRCKDNNPRAATHYGKWVLTKGNSMQSVGLMSWEFVPAFTLQDVLEKLTFIIKNRYILEFDVIAPNEYRYKIRNIYADSCDICCIGYSSKNILDAAFGVLCEFMENSSIKK